MNHFASFQVTQTLNNNKLGNHAEIARLALVFALVMILSFALANTAAAEGTVQTSPVPASNQTGSAATQAPYPEPPELDNVAYLLMDYGTGQVLAEKNADLPLPPASLTKMMTSYLLEQKLISGEIKNEDMIPVSRQAACDLKKGESCMFLRSGRPAAAIDMLRGIVIQSGNDASRAVAEHIGGTEEAFAELMNQKAAELGMKDTHFRNATGMPQIGHESTARDLATLARVIIKKSSIYYPIYAEKHFKYDNIKQYNRNQLLFSDPTVDGLKTGHTNEAGYCLIASSLKDGTRLISVILGTKSKAERTRQSRTLLKWGFNNFKTASIAPQSMFVAKAPVWYGKLDEVNLITQDALDVVLPKTEQGEITTKSEFADGLEAPLKAGQVVGLLSAYLGDKKLASTNIVVEKNIEKGGFFSRLWDSVKRFFVELF